MRKVPDDAQACNVWVGEMACLKYQVAAFVRLSEARSVGEITEVPIPTRFIFLLLGPPGSEAKCIEMGRSFSTVMVDEVCTDIHYCHKITVNLVTPRKTRKIETNVYKVFKVLTKTVNCHYRKHTFSD